MASGGKSYLMKYRCLDLLPTFHLYDAEKGTFLHRLDPHLDSSTYLTLYEKRDTVLLRATNVYGFRFTLIDASDKTVAKVAPRAGTRDSFFVWLSDGKDDEPAFHIESFKRGRRLRIMRTGSGETVGTLHVKSFFSREVSRVWVAHGEDMPTLAMVMITSFMIIYHDRSNDGF